MPSAKLLFDLLPRRSAQVLSRRALAIWRGPATCPFDSSESAQPTAHVPAPVSTSRFAPKQTVLRERWRPSGGVELKIIATILETSIIERILEHIGLRARTARARGRRPAPNVANGLTGLARDPSLRFPRTPTSRAGQAGLRL